MRTRRRVGVLHPRLTLPSPNLFIVTDQPSCRSLAVQRVPVRGPHTVRGLCLIVELFLEMSSKPTLPNHLAASLGAAYSRLVKRCEECCENDYI